MNQLVADESLADTRLAPEERGQAMEFTYKSGNRPLEGYTIKRGLGTGGFGEVYYAISDGGKEVALKLIRRYLDVELRGVSHCLNLKNPHLLQIFDVRRNDTNEDWIVMEYMAGRSLQEVLEEANGPLPFDESMRWLSAIADGIDYLHDNGIVHRDLKPGNIFQEDDAVKVGDYGLSKFISHSRRSGQTQSVGTVHYMAPEISTGNYGKNVDIYSACVITFEMLTGDVPFDGETSGEVLMKHLTAEPRLELLEPKFRNIFAKAFAKKPEDRFDSVKEFQQVVEATQRGEAVEVKVPKPLKQAAAPPVEAPKPAPAVNHDLKKSLPPVPGTFAAKRRAVSDTMWSMFQGGILSAILPILVLVLDEAPDLKSYISLAVLGGAATWGIQIFSRFWEARQVDASSRRLSMLLFGLAFGAAALGMNLWLNHMVPQRVLNNYLVAVTPNAMFESVMQPLLVYLCLFGLAFMIPDWANSACKARDGRFSLGRVLWPGGLAFFLASIFENGPDPTWVAGILAITAIVVQWVSPYESPRQRARWRGRYGYSPS